MKTKCAIFNYSGKAANRGGPAGYLNNLYLGFGNSEDVPDFLYVSGGNKKKNVVENNETKKPSTMRRIGYFIKKGLRTREKLKKIINNYDVVHTHSTEDVIYLRKFCNYKGGIVFTPHRPETFGSENMLKGDKKRSIISLFYVFVEKKSYKYADAFIFPSGGAKDIYNQFPGFDKYSENKPVEYFFTGVNKKIITKSKNEYRAEHDISDDAFMISYIGRHNYIKGYDRLVRAYKGLDGNNLKFVVAGAINPDIEFPKSDKWVELGYITDAQDLMNASSVIVIPNRNTYFDLVIIEALSVGKIVISSNTGGNVDISKYTKGLILFDNEDEDSLEKAIKDIYKMNTNEIKDLEESNVSFYEEYCTLEKFSKNYIVALSKIVDKMKN